jgi:hypothetical protein
MNTNIVLFVDKVHGTRRSADRGATVQEFIKP